MNLRRKQGLATLLILACLAAPDAASPDTIYFKNGRHMEGVIEKVTADEVTVRVGVSSVTLKRSKIKGVKRASDAGGEDLKKAWREKYFAHSKYAPADYQDLAAQYRSLEDARTAARQAVQQVEEIKGAQEALYREAKQLATDIHASSLRLRELTPEANPRAYRNALFGYNAAIARLQVINKTTEEDSARIQGHMSAVATYTRMLSGFRTEFEAAQATYGEAKQDEVTSYFFDAIDTALEQYAGDFELETVDAQQQNGQMVVTARINDDTTVNLLVDTGASVVALSRRTGERLGMVEGHGGIMQVTLADGSTAEAEPVVLKSIQVGELRSENVPAVILPESLSGGIDGLLGMSFLRDFSIEYDTRSNHLLLKRYNPGP